MSFESTLAANNCSGRSDKTIAVVDGRVGGP